MQLIDLDKDPDDWEHTMEAGGNVSLEGTQIQLDGPSVLVSKYVDGSLKALIDAVIATVAHRGTLSVRDHEGRAFVLTVENADVVTWHIREVDV